VPGSKKLSHLNPKGSIVVDVEAYGVSVGHLRKWKNEINGRIIHFFLEKKRHHF
jgi:hypothetical protein